MARSSCHFCGKYCFVVRRLPATARRMPGEYARLATCEWGATYDRGYTGYDHSTAAQPRATVVAGGAR